MSLAGQPHGGGGRGRPAAGHARDPGLRGVTEREPGRAPAPDGVRADGELGKGRVGTAGTLSLVCGCQAVGELDDLHQDKWSGPVGVAAGSYHPD